MFGIYICVKNSVTVVKTVSAYYGIEKVEDGMPKVLQQRVPYCNWS